MAFERVYNDNIPIEYVHDFGKCYRFYEKIGKGRYGVVRRARRVETKWYDLRSHCACKIVRRSSDYLREIDHLVSCMGCHGVIKLNRIVFTRKKMLLEFPLGTSFARFIEKKIFTSLYQHLLDTLGVATRLLYTISHIHERGIVHRDIKPLNLVTVEDQLFLIDFGLSKRIRGPEQVPEAYDIVTYPYRAPELLRILGSTYGPLVDEWSLGCILVEVFTGISPFDGNNERETKNLVRAYIWHRMGGEQPEGVKEPFDIIQMMKDAYDAFYKYEGDNERIRHGRPLIKKRRECKKMFQVLCMMVEMLLEPDDSNRIDSSTLLEVIGFSKLKWDRQIAAKSIPIVKIYPQIFQNTLVEYFVFCNDHGSIPTKVFYHSIFLWREILLKMRTFGSEEYTGLDDNSRRRVRNYYQTCLLTCTKLVISYEGISVKLWNSFKRFYNIWSLGYPFKKERIEKMTIQILMWRGGRVWMEESDCFGSLGTWKESREKAFVFKMLRNAM